MSQSNYLTPTDFTRLMVGWLKKYRYIIIISAVAGGLALGIYARISPVTYTSKATIFSLSSADESPAASSALSLLLGGEASKSFSDETSINIIELSESRAISEAVAAVPVPAMGNKIIAILLIDDINEHRSLMQSKIRAPKNKDTLITLAGIFLKAGLSATINRNNSFVLNYTGKSEKMVKVITYAFIDKISQFYIDIKREKAKRDYEFATNKVDSLRKVMGAKDYMLIAMDKKTLFTNTDKMEYRVPTENIAEDKQLIRNQYSQAVINQQTATYKLQKETPLIRVLDKPEPPFETNSKSTLLYSIIGLLIGGISMAGLVISRLFLRYSGQEISRALLGTNPSKSNSSAA